MQRVAISQAAGPIAHDLHISKQQMGSVFGVIRTLSYALFEIPMGLLGDRLGVKRVAGADCVGLVCLHSPHRRRMEHRLARR